MYSRTVHAADQTQHGTSIAPSIAGWRRCIDLLFDGIAPLHGTLSGRCILERHWPSCPACQQFFAAGTPFLSLYLMPRTLVILRSAM